ncbi:MAG: glycosyltransferase [Candidatus Sumerlaeia bacterium]
MAKAIRVVHIIDSMDVGGAQTQILNWFRTIDRKHCEMRLVCLREKGAFGEAIEKMGFPVVVMGKRSRVQVDMLFRLFRLLREWKPDVVHCTIFTANLWGRLAGFFAGAPVLITHEQSTVSLEKWYRKWIDRALSWISYRILTVSDDLRQRVIAEEKIAPDRVEVMYNAVDTQAIYEAGEKPLEAELPLPDDAEIIVGAVGRLEYRKDHISLVQAAAKALKKEPRLAFVLVGEGPDRARIEAEIARQKIESRFILLGERHDVPALLRRFDIYVLSSITEGLSLSILEAMAASCAVVATRVGGNSELLDQGQCGKLVEARDPDAMAEAILDLSKKNDERKRMAHAAQKRAREIFDIHPIVRSLEALYSRALREKKFR